MRDPAGITLFRDIFNQKKINLKHSYVPPIHYTVIEEIIPLWFGFTFLIDVVTTICYTN